MAEIIAKIVEAASNVVKEVVNQAVGKGAELPRVRGEYRMEMPEKPGLSSLQTPLTTQTTETLKAFAYAQMPFITNQQQKEEEEEKQEELERGRGDLLQLELKSHLSQLKTPGLSLKQRKKDYGKRGQEKQRSQNISALIYEMIRSILHIFPWFFNFIKGVVILRSTKQS